MPSFEPSPEDVADEILKAAIDYTISQDFATGHSAEQGRRLQGFHGEGNSNESTSGPPSDPAFPSHPLSHLPPERFKDYQMQMMLFEQQEKKRWLMARDQAESEMLDQMQAEQLELSGRKRRKLKAPANDMEENLASTSATTGQVTNGLDQASHYKALSCHFRVLYKVDCNSSHRHRYHRANLFEDAPSASFSSHGGEKTQKKRQTTEPAGEIHVGGQAPIYDLEEYMEENSDLAFIVLRRCQCPGRTQIRGEEIYVTSSTLRSALYAVARCYISRLPKDKYSSAITPAIPPPLVEEQILQNPYLYIYHHRLLLQEYIDKNPEASIHVNSLLAYMSQKYGDSYRAADTLFREQVVTREHELTLYVPNDIVVTFDRDIGEFCRKFVLPRIPEDTQCKIEALTVVPLRFINSDVFMKLVLRGQKHWSLRNQSYISYKGWNKSKDQFYPDSRFMIDHKTFHRIHPGSEAFRFDKPDRLPLDPRPLNASLETTDNQDLHLLLPPDTYGFYFTEKKWINIFVDNIRPVTWNKTAYDRLVLPPQTKELVKALVTVRTSQRGVKQGLGLAGKREDIIAGKGNGLIMLLHGGPGTGKSLTAAEMAEMPLYRVTCGDIGTSADMVEKYLNNLLTLGKEWNCVLLLDEADVFLEERSMSDLKRNSLVSVFLRVLEYYDGILMLTSNRVGTFDEAFKSRIQVALYYKALTRSSRKKIWQNFLEMLEEDEEDVDLDELRNRLDELAGHELNGRQIRNTLTTARQLAIYKKEQLEWRHLEHALSLSTEFNNYIKRVQGHTDAQWATEEGIRA
ncbi:hypothetical protein JMJ35_000169 [Cladonia borealis]|uniref:AAA+ ATPase domain-containing protein n=1 Tax=Cladonia borealis TaxID=184061 RepID=A0AA39RAW8_9LECA|nr:hypothetical protein JMJ35_000169 [Cladonia borealis]